MRSSIYEATSSSVEFLLNEMKVRYFTQMEESLCRFPADNASTELMFVHTPVHGVGDPSMARAFSGFHLQPYTLVHAQVLPHPYFPILDSPNPEEGK